ncbi:MAG TPA: type VI secretion protein IcmF/TssM N-terminal domain-containing protein [Gemmataceae bacterium]|jgi:hypothetical protein
MYQVLTGLVNTVRSWVGLVLPVFAKAGDFRHWPRWAWQVVHVAILAAVLVGLWYLNRVFDVRRYLLTHHQFLQEFYLPLVFLLLYALSWLGYWVWRLLGEEEAAAEFPDVDAAWREAVAKLDAQGIGLADAPLYLVLGRPAAGEDALFQAAEQQVAVRAPAAADVPLRVYAHRDAIFVTCGGASAWGRFAALLAGEEEAGGSVLKTAAPAADKTIQFGSEAMGIPQEMIDELRELLAKQQQRDLTPEERSRLQELAELTKGPAQPKRRAALSPEAQARGTERLRFLCRLIRRDRRPWCPVNGMLVLVPWAATESDDAAKEAAAMLQRDLAAAREALQLRYPTFALVCDLETARGFPEFRRSFTPETLKKGRIGQRLPLVPDVAPAEVPALLERGVQWIGQTVLPAGIVKFLRTDAPPGDPRKTPSAATGHNRNLYMLLHGVYDRGPRLARVLSRGLPGGSGQDAADPLDALPLFGGCYLAGTGRTPQDQAFVPAVVQRLFDAQSSVSWTSAALAEDARHRRWTAIGYAGTAVVLAVGLFLAVWSVRG